jgi:hypothetical protein
LVVPKDKKKPERLQYGAWKYAAISLLISRWLRAIPQASRLVYVTLAGTELGDLKSLHFIDPLLVHRAYAFEIEKDRYEIAKSLEAQFRDRGVELVVINGNVFDYVRASDLPHLFFIDGLGIFAWSDYDARLGRLFQRQIIREGDCLIITSHLGHRPEIEHIKRTFSGELSVLGVSGDLPIGKLFRRAHTSFTLFRALTKFRLTQELNVRCFACVKYRDSTPMGVFGYIVGPGQTELRALVEDAGTAHFDMNAISSCPREDF